MNQAHIHLLINHLPILGALFGMLTLAAGFLLKNSTVKRTALGLFTFAALCAVPAYLTGEGAEEVVENLPGVSDALMERHEELANIFLGVTGALGLLALFTFFVDYKGKKSAGALYTLTFIVSLGAMVFAQQVGTSGGEIRHTEIRNGATAVVSPGGGESAEDDD